MTIRTRENGFKEKLGVIAFGPTIVRVPVSHFTRHRVDKQMVEDMWRRIVGPSVERHMMKRHEPWRIIVFAYMEGLQHGSSLMLERAEEEKKKDQPVQPEPKGWMC